MSITACLLCCKANHARTQLWSAYLLTSIVADVACTKPLPYLDTVPEGMGSSISSCAVAVSKHNARAVQQAQVLVQDHFLDCTGHPRGVTRLSHPGPLQTVQQGALAHIGKPNHS